jgi:site-specific DNA recombinase
LKIAWLFLNKDFVYSDNDTTNHLKDEVRIVYGAQSLNTKENFEEAETIKNISKEQQELITSIIKIELDKGNKISTQSAINVLSFLLKLAKTCISIKMKVS